MADYKISAILSLKDELSGKLSAAAKKAQEISKGIGAVSKGIGDIKPLRLNVQGLEKLQRYQQLLKSAGMTVPKPLNISVNDSATSKISKLRSDLMAFAGRSWNVAVNIKTNGMAALTKAKSAVSEMAAGAAMATGAGMLGLAGVGFGAMNVVDTYKNFEYQMARNKALFTTGLDSETAIEQYHELEEAARHYGSITKFTAAEVAKAEEYMALAGWNAPTAVKALPAVLNAAVASGEDLSLVSDIITDDMTAMGYKAGTVIKNALGQDVEAAQHFADVMLRTTLRSNTNFEQLGYAMKYAAPLAHTLGYDIEDVAIAMGLMANNGIKADQAGTALRGILNRLIKPPKQAAQALEQLGLSEIDATQGLMPTLMTLRAALTGKSDESILDIAEAISGEELENRAEVTEFLKEARERGGGKLSAKDQAKLGSMISGTYAMAGFLALMNSSDEDIDNLTGEIKYKSDGTGASIQAEMMNTLSGDLDAMKAAWEDFNIELLSGGGGDGIRSFIQGLTDDINTFKTAIKDGLDFGDIANLGVKVLSQLKNKFLELNGIGSLLAGGALFLGLKKMLSMALQMKDALSGWAKVKTAGDLGGMIRGGATMGSVGTMHISAGVVNLTGAIRGLPSNGNVITGRGGGIVTPNQRGSVTPQNPNGQILVSNRSGSIITPYNSANRQNVAARNSAYVDDYYSRKANILASTPAPQQSTLRANLGGIGAGVGLSAIFALMDIAQARSHSEVTMQEARDTVAYHKQVLEQLQASNASQEEIQMQMQNVSDAELFVERTKAMNAQVERQADLGAAGMVAGTAAGAALGSFIPLIGTMIGGMIGGILGQWAGVKLAETKPPENTGRGNADWYKRSPLENPPPSSLSSFRQEDEKYSTAYKVEKVRQNEESLRKGAEGIRRHSRGYIDKPITVAEENAANASREAYLKDERLKQQRVFGGRYVGDVTPYTPKDAREEAALRSYDAAHLPKKHGGAQGTFSENESVNQFKSNLDKMSATTAEWNNQQKRQVSTLQSLNDETKSTGILEGVGNLIEGLLFNKAEASEITPDTNLETSRPTPRIEETPKPSGGFFDNIELPDLSELFGGLEFPNLSELFSNVEFPDLSELFGGFEFPNLSELFSNVEFPDLGELFSGFEFPDLGIKISEAFANIELPDLSELFSGLEFPELGISEKISAEIEGANEILSSFVEGITSTFSGLSAGISGALSGVGSEITSVFSSAAAEVQGIWGAVPGFFSGVFGGLGGAASAAGSAIAAGLTSAIGTVIGAWQSAAATISGIISSIAAAASEAVASAGAAIGIGHNATGTSYWKGGFTEINEHGGEIVNLPSGTQIIPHATTVSILKREISNSIQKGESSYHGLNFVDYGLLERPREIQTGTRWNTKTPDILGGIFPERPREIQTGTRWNMKTPDILGGIFPERPREIQTGTRWNTKTPDILGGIFSGSFEGLGSIFSGEFNLPSILNFGAFNPPQIELPTAGSSNTTTNSNSSNTFNFGGVNITSGADFDEFVHRLSSMLGHSAINYG